MKYMHIDLYTGECTELQWDEFYELSQECDEIVENDKFISFKFEEYVVIENKTEEMENV